MTPDGVHLAYDNLQAVMSSSNSKLSDLPLPLRIRTHDLIGVPSLPPTDPLIDRLLVCVFGVLQVLYESLPHPATMGKADSMIAALMRDGYLAMGAAILLIRKALFEPTLRVARGLLEARLFAQRLRAADGEHAAGLLAADRLLSRKRRIERQIEVGLKAPGDPPTVAKLREIKEQLKGKMSTPVAELRLLKQSGHQWHGFKNIEELAVHLGDAAAYHFGYAPTSLFVHAGDPDVHFAAGNGAAQLQELVRSDAVVLTHTKRFLIIEAYDLVEVAAQPWTLAGELRLAIDELLPLMIIAATPEHTTEDLKKRMEESTGLPPTRWGELLNVVFD